MATHSSILAWRISWTEKPGGLQSIEAYRVRHDRSDLARISTQPFVTAFFHLAWCFQNSSVMWHESVLYGWIIFHWIYSRFYQFISWCTFKLFPVFYYYEQCCCEHSLQNLSEPIQPFWCFFFSFLIIVIKFIYQEISNSLFCLNNIQNLPLTYVFRSLLVVS